MQEDENTTVRLFEYFYSKLYKTSYKVNLELQNQKKLLKNFTKALYKQYIPGTLGMNFFIDYFSFSFAYFFQKKIHRPISLNWIASKRLLKRYIERPDGTDYHTKQFLREHNINLSELRSSLVDDFAADYLHTDRDEESRKGRIADTDARLYYCLTDTTMYNHRSVICLSCSQRVTCKRLLMHSNPSLYKKRGYGSTTL